MKKKAGILTWHYLDNYGSVLQAYALMTLLQKEDVDVEFINYRKNAKTNIFYNLLRNIKYSLPTSNPYNLRKKKFYKFRHAFFKESKMYGNYSELCNANLDYDFVVCGSDQIWSGKVFDKAYFFDFIKKNTIPCYSYAPSTIENKYNEEQINIIKENLKKFKKISTREKLGTEIIKQYTDTKVTEVLDPTLLVPASEWDYLISSDKNGYSFKNYAFCYFIGEDDKYESIMNKIKKQYNCDDIININIKPIHNFGTILKDASPTDFLRLIKEAKVVVTDSYHGILFSLIFHKQFVPIKRFESKDNDNQNERLHNILRKIDCEDRYISAYDKKISNIPLDYKIIDQKLTDSINISKQYIKSIIKEVKND